MCTRHATPTPPPRPTPPPYPTRSPRPTPHTVPTPHTLPMPCATPTPYAAPTPQSSIPSELTLPAPRRLAGRAPERQLAPTVQRLQFRGLQPGPGAPAAGPAQSGRSPHCAGNPTAGRARPPVSSQPRRVLPLDSPCLGHPRERPWCLTLSVSPLAHPEGGRVLMAVRCAGGAPGVTDGHPRCRERSRDPGGSSGCGSHIPVVRCACGRSGR